MRVKSRIATVAIVTAMVILLLLMVVWSLKVDFDRTRYSSTSGELPGTNTAVYTAIAQTMTAKALATPTNVLMITTAVVRRGSG